MADKFIQPAVKSYFFGKGYRDLGNTIADSWHLNLDSAKNYWEKGTGSWNSSGFHKIMAIAMYFAAISVVAFGTVLFITLSVVHIGVLAVFFSLIYISFTILYLAERGYMLYTGIFTACPDCHKKNDLPYYLCPGCGAVHTRLIPSSYGILHRVCSCGRKIPATFFNGRKKLEARCPACSKAIESQETKPICIPIVGGASVGKTCFLFSATREFIENIAVKYSWHTRFMNKYNEDLYNRVLNDFARGIKPHKTVEFNPTAFNYFVKTNNSNREKLLYLYDSAGEAFSNTADLVNHRFYGYLHGMVFIVDPFSIPELLNRYSKNIGSYGDNLKPSTSMLEDVFDKMLINLEQKHSVKRDKKVNIPCAIVVNKVDAFDLEDKIGENAARELIHRDDKIKTIENAIDFLCKELFMDCGLGNFLRKVEQKFSSYKIFTGSALGNMPDGSGKKFKPYRVIEPLMWILNNADKDFRM